jgi:voltage-gated potassium channel
MTDRPNLSEPGSRAVDRPQTDGTMTRRNEVGMGAWDALVTAATVVIAVVTPVDIVFDSVDAGWLRVISVAISVLFAIDIRRRLSRPITAGGRPVTDAAVIRRHYLRGWFVVDLLAAIPFDVIAAAPGIADGDAATVVRFLGLLRLLRVARIFELQREWRVRTSFNPALLRLAFFAFWIALSAHWIACGWIALDGTAAGHPELFPYQQALYWTITTLTTVGYGDITPIGRSQVTYTMVVMALGAAMYGYIIGNVASLLANLDVIRSRHLGRIEMINHFMRDRRVPRDLQAQVRDYYNYLWESRMGQQSELLDDLPEPLRIEIALHLNRSILRKVPIFEGASEAFLRDLVLHLDPMVFLPGQALMRRGEIGHRIYFINKGRVDVLSHDDSEVIATLTDGDFVGEMALLSSQPRANTVLALDYCNVYALDREGFDRVLESFPDVAAEVQHIADLRRAESPPDLATRDKG